jgi:hypothetical protein
MNLRELAERVGKVKGDFEVVIYDEGTKREFPLSLIKINRSTKEVILS